MAAPAAGDARPSRHADTITAGQQKRGAQAGDERAAAPSLAFAFDVNTAAFARCSAAGQLRRQGVISSSSSRHAERAQRFRRPSLQHEAGRAALDSFFQPAAAP